MNHVFAGAAVGSVRAVLILLALAICPARASATNSSEELRVVLRNLMNWLPGEYDNAAQVFFEREKKTPEAEVHSRIYRAYHRLDAPAIGEHVLLVEVRDGGKSAALDLAEFQVWTLSLDAQRRAVRMSPHRLVDEATLAPFVRDPSKFKSLTPAALRPAEGVSGCEIWWRLRGEQLVGRTAPGTCRGISRRTGGPMDLSWEFTQSETQQWVSFAGRDRAGRIILGREDQTEWRLDKARDFECLFGYRPEGEPPVVLNGARMHDRGDRYVWQPKTREPKTFTIELIRGMWPSSSGRNFEDLLRIYMYEGDPGDPPDVTRLLGMGWAGAASDRASFGSGIHNARCKLYDPSAPPPRNE